MLKKIQPIYIVSILTAVVGFASLFIVYSFFGLNKETTMYIGAAIFAPVLAIIVGEYLRQRTERQREEYETLKDLISFRHLKGSQNFLSALNRVILVFDNNADIKRLVKELWNGYVNLENRSVSNRREVELIHAICKHMNRNVNEFEIDSFFIPAPTVSTPITDATPQNPPSSTSGDTNQ
jgi:hypothetical protein